MARPPRTELDRSWKGAEEFQMADRLVAHDDWLPSLKTCALGKAVRSVVVIKFEVGLTHFWKFILTVKSFPVSALAREA
jgi:hypothetical protein